MKLQHVVLCSLLVTQSLAQINLSSILSDAESIFTSLTSALAATPSSTSSSPQTTSSSSTSSSTSSITSSTMSSSTRPASAGSTASNSAAAQSSASSASAAAASSTHSSKNGGGSSSDTLPIVLGCTLGALAIAAFIGLCLICRRRRNKKSRAAAKTNSHSISDDESDMYAREKHPRSSFKGPTERTRDLGTTDASSTAPLASRLSHDRQYSGYGRYPDRNSGGLAPTKPAYYNHSDNIHGDDMASNSVHPFSPDHVQSYGSNAETSMGRHNNGHYGEEALAAGVGGAALGGLAAHEHNKHKARRSGSRSRGINGVDTNYSEDEHNALPQADMAANDRRSGSVSRASLKEPWPYTGSEGRSSHDGAISRPRSISRGRDTFTSPEQRQSDRHSGPSDAALIGTAAAGGLAGAAAAHHHHTNSRSPHRKGILKNARPASASQSTSPENEASGPHELESVDVPAPNKRSKNRRHSPLGYAAPAAAIGANRSPTRNRRKSWSRNSSTPDIPSTLANESSQDSDIPSVPSRSPRRNSLHSNARYSMDNGGTVELPAHQAGDIGAPTHGLVSPTVEPHRSLVDDGVVSPISPTNSQPGTWSKAQAQELGMAPIENGTKSSSQESTVVGTNPTNSESVSRENSKGQSSGLVTAIQRIFNSPKESWNPEDTVLHNPPRRSFGDRTMPISENVYEDNRHISSVPHRKPAPVVNAPYHKEYSAVNQHDTMPGSWANEPTPATQHQYQSSHNPNANIPPYSSTTLYPTTSVTDPNTNANIQNTGRPRTATRPGYGIGSGDPYDLARVRTDSSMTGISLLNYVELEKNTSTNPARPRSRSPRKSVSSTEYREPTLAELRRQVEAEDRQRGIPSGMGKSGRRSFGASSRKSAEGSRYGDDRELFGSLIPGVDGHDYGYPHAQQNHGYAQGYGQAY